MSERSRKINQRGVGRSQETQGSIGNLNTGQLVNPEIRERVWGHRREKQLSFEIIRLAAVE